MVGGRRLASALSSFSGVAGVGGVSLFGGAAGRSLRNRRSKLRFLIQMEPLMGPAEAGADGVALA
jgi:hypothetical protein